MNKGLQRAVSPKMAAVVILIVIAAVQAWWWRAFVWRAPGASGVSSGSMSPTPPGPNTAFGRPDVYVETVAGTGEPGDADGMGRDARFDGPVGIAVGPDGAVYVADSRNHRIRVIAPDGETTTLCGSTAGYEDGPAASAKFLYPCGVAVSPSGTVYVSDTGNHRIRAIHDGIVTTIAGGERGLATGKGTAARFHTPLALAYSAAPGPGLLIADAGNRRLRRAALDGTVSEGMALPGAPTSVAAGASQAVAIPDSGLLLINGKSVTGAPILGSVMTLAKPSAICDIGNGDWIVADAAQGAVLRLRDGAVEVLAGGYADRGSLVGQRDFGGDKAQFGRIGGLTTDNRGRIYVADTDGNAIRRVTAP